MFNSAKLLNVNFYLTEVAKTGYHEASITYWADFTTQLCHIYGTCEARSDGSKKKLERPIQKAHKTPLVFRKSLRRVDRVITEADRMHHIMKGTNHFAFTALALQNLSTVADVATICQRLDEQQSIHLQQETAPPQHLGKRQPAGSDTRYPRRALQSRFCLCFRCPFKSTCNLRMGNRSRETWGKVWSLFS